jgi:branched-subunit amino acid transport protein
MGHKMQDRVILLAGAVGLCVYILRVGPMLLRGYMPSGGLWARFFAATGPAAIATLAVASIAPSLASNEWGLALIGAGVVGAVYWGSASVVLATLAGAAAYGAAFALLL